MTSTDFHRNGRNIPKQNTYTCWKEFYNELIYIQGKRGLIKPREVWVQEISKSDSNIKKNENFECSICLDFLNRDIAVLSCNHLFHFDCICKWYLTNNYEKMNNNSYNEFIEENPYINCPICRNHSTIDQLCRENPKWLYSKVEKTKNKQNNNNQNSDRRLDSYNRRKLCKRLTCLINVLRRHNRIHAQQEMVNEIVEEETILAVSNVNVIRREPSYIRNGRRIRRRKSGICVIL
tara:strand:- start:121 stop:825 length:705 start_codon:yes stop_codon:yes gene_type:complete